MNQTPAKARQTPEDEYPEHTSRARSTQLKTRTPRFRLGPALSQGSSVPFASTPRFLFGGGGSQSQGLATNDDINQDDQEDVHDLNRPPSTFHGEVIHDSDSESVKGDQRVFSGRGDDIQDQPVTHEGDSDGGDEMLLSLSPILPGTKRRRQLSRLPSIESNSGVRNIPGTDTIISSSPESPPPATVEKQMSPPSELHEEEFITPTRRELFPSIHASKGSSLSARHPRFIANSRQMGTPTPGKHKLVNAPESTPRQKPRFVLPSTPDTTHGEKRTDPMTSPTPFSPLACRTKRGRAGSLVKPDFVPKGMAAEVQNWIFEIGAKRQALSHSPTPGSKLFSSIYPTQAAKKVEASQIHPPDKYCLTKRLASVKYSIKGSARNQQSPYKSYSASAGHSAPFILATLGGQEKGAENLSSHLVLLFNSPLRAASRTHPAYMSLQKGDHVGVRRELAWEIEIDTPTAGKDNVNTAEKASQSCLVGVEWDILD